jgi:hypothetical protein
MNLVKIRIAVVAGEDEENVRSTASVAAASGNAGRRTPSRATRDGLHRTVLVVLRVLGTLSRAQSRPSSAPTSSSPTAADPGAARRDGRACARDEGPRRYGEDGKPISDAFVIG